MFQKEIALDSLERCNSLGHSERVDPGKGQEGARERHEKVDSKACTILKKTSLTYP
jgi:hypothetical protein